jgi:hypothetical protein
LNRSLSLLGGASGRAIYDVMLKHEHIYSDLPTMRLAGKMRMDLSVKRDNSTSGVKDDQAGARLAVDQSI